MSRVTHVNDAQRGGRAYVERVVTADARKRMIGRNQEALLLSWTSFLKYTYARCDPIAQGEDILTFVDDSGYVDLESVNGTAVAGNSTQRNETSLVIIPTRDSYFNCTQVLYDVDVLRRLPCSRSLRLKLDELLVASRPIQIPRSFPYVHRISPFFGTVVSPITGLSMHAVG